MVTKNYIVTGSQVNFFIEFTSRSSSWNHTILQLFITAFDEILNAVQLDKRMEGYATGSAALEFDSKLNQATDLQLK